MPRYIDADKFEVFHYEKTRGRESTFDDGVQFVLEKIDEAPTEDVAPVKHAKWEDNGANYKCSNCGNTEPYYDMLYCPSCGAIMDEEVTSGVEEE